MEFPKTTKNSQQPQANKPEEKRGTSFSSPEMIRQLKKKMDDLVSDIMRLRSQRTAERKSLNKKREGSPRKLLEIKAHPQSQIKRYHEYDRNLKIVQAKAGLKDVAAFATLEDYIKFKESRKESRKIIKLNQQKINPIELNQQKINLEEKILKNLIKQRDELRRKTDQTSVLALQAVLKNIESHGNQISQLNDQNLIIKNPSKKDLVLERRIMINLFTQFKNIKKIVSLKKDKLSNYSRDFNSLKNNKDKAEEAEKLKRKIGLLQTEIENLTQGRVDNLSTLLTDSGFLGEAGDPKRDILLKDNLKGDEIEQIFKPYLEGQYRSWQYRSWSEIMGKRKAHPRIEKFHQQIEKRKAIPEAVEKSQKESTVVEKEEKDISTRNLANLAELLAAKDKEAQQTQQEKKKAA